MSHFFGMASKVAGERVDSENGIILLDLSLGLMITRGLCEKQQCRNTNPVSHLVPSESILVHTSTHVQVIPAVVATRLCGTDHS